LSYVGIDFGTTNSAVAIAEASGPSRLVPLTVGTQVFETFRSVLFFEKQEDRLGTTLAHWAGPEAIEAYLDSEGEGRFVQSVKSYLASKDFTGTNILGKQFGIEPLVSLILKDLKAKAETSAGPLPRTIVVGRPAHFVGDSGDDAEAMALDRLREAFRLAGVHEIRFELEPVAAAYHYESGLERDELVLIADFGGGTSDFSLLSLAPNDRTQPGQIEILGNDGVAFAGDVFDRAIVRHAVAPRLGKGSHYVSGPDKVLPMPDWVYAKLERWHYLSFLKSAPTIEIIERVQATSDAPQEIAALLNLIDGDLGYELHAQVNRTKMELSSSMESQFHFDLFPAAIDWDATRGEFTEWIQPQLDGIARTVDALVGATGVRPDAIDRVFLTGGSSFVPAVRDIFIRTFGQDKLAGGNELTSVATGLALRGLV
jgi:hypothetical chaperone protein